MDLKNASREGNKRGRVTALAATLALTVCWSISAHSRTPTEVDCDKFARSMQSLEVPTRSLALTQVDHVPISSESVDFTTADTIATSAEQATPLLDLTPRAEDALRDIFEAGRDVELRKSALEMPSSPIAETEELPDISELPDNATPAAPISDDIDLPLLQRQMYRTDI